MRHIRIILLFSVLCFFLALSGVEGFSVLCYAEPVAVIVNKANTQDEVSSQELSRIYKGRMTKWPDGAKVVVINRESTAPIREAFYKTVLGAKVTDHFLLPASGLPFKSVIQSSSAIVKRIVIGVPGAIGYIYLNEVDETVKVLKIDGVSPGDEGYKLE